MTEARIGRIVVAALHQAVADTLPLRLEFYEDYLPPRRLRAGTIGVASFSAALSFLRREGTAYDAIIARAGEYAADWTWADTSRLRRALWCRLPPRWRLRRALGLARELVRGTVGGSGASVSINASSARLDIRRSAFCDVREPSLVPLCGFYRAAVERFCARLALDTSVGVSSCRAMGMDGCRMSVSLVEPADVRRIAPSPGEGSSQSSAGDVQ